jgi:hypothetical protein
MPIHVHDFEDGVYSCMDSWRCQQFVFSIADMLVWVVACIVVWGHAPMFECPGCVQNEDCVHEIWYTEEGCQSVVGVYFWSIRMLLYNNAVPGCQKKKISWWLKGNFRRGSKVQGLKKNAMLVCLVKTLSCTHKILSSYPPGYVRLQGTLEVPSGCFWLFFASDPKKGGKKKEKKNRYKGSKSSHYEDFFWDGHI